MTYKKRRRQATNQSHVQALSTLLPLSLGTSGVYILVVSLLTIVTNCLLGVRVLRRAKWES